MSGWNFHIVKRGHNTKPSIGGLLGSTMFGLVFAGLAIFMGHMILKGHQKDLAMLAWETVPCTIVKSAIDTVGEGKYSFAAEYTYEHGGRAYTGRRYSRTENAHVFETVSEKGPLLKRYPVGIGATCHVNPENPADSVLTRSEGAFPWLPIIFLVPFVLAGLGLSFGSWVVWARQRRAAGTGQPEPDGKNPTRPWRFLLIAFGLLFACAGVGVGFAMFPSIAQWRASSAWVETPAVVTASAVRSSRSNDSTTYRPYIAYAYTVDGTTYENDDYDFWGVSSGGYDSKAEIVRAHPVGREISVYVNPENPGESVISKRAGVGLFFALFPPLFFGVGCAILAAGFRAGRARPDARAGGSSREPRGVPISQKTRGRVIGSTLFALVWNAIVSIFVHQAWRSVKAGRPDWFLIVFLIPFVVIGLGSLVGAVVEFLRLFNPKIEILPDVGDICLGKPLRLGYRALGSVHRITKLRISLHGIEKTIDSEEDSPPNEEEFFSAVLLETTSPAKMMQGRLETELPADGKPSFQGDDVVVEWLLKVEGDVARWPDIQDEHLLHVQEAEVKFG
ncbi:MAG: DUF3592 domain-containing protein [Kiritimatiellia bacterium]